jgi:drug/metabolite transporter (DMT)-like permease
MPWLMSALLGMSIWSVAAVVDRFALHGRVHSTRFYVVIPALVQLPLALLLYPVFAPTSFEVTTVAVSIFGGILEIFLLYYMFAALSVEEAGRIFPLIGFGALFTLLGEWLLLGGVLEAHEFGAFFLLIAGGVVIAFKRQPEGYRLSKSIRPLLLLSVFGAAYPLVLRYAFLESDFATGFFFSRVGFFAGGLFVLFFWRDEILGQWHELTTNFRVLLVGNQIVSFSGHAFYFSALALANAALVQSVLSIQGAVIFFIALVVSYVNPALVGESITKHDIVQKVVGISLIVVALNLLI